jgi:hypothetical protein
MTRRTYANKVLSTTVSAGGDVGQKSEVRGQKSEVYVILNPDVSG